MYATTGTAAKFWGIWKEPEIDLEGLRFTHSTRPEAYPL
jgi:hypothetical protein